MPRSLSWIQGIIPRMSTLSSRPQFIPGASSHAPTGTAHDSPPNPLSSPLRIRNSPYKVPTLMYGTAWKKQRTADLVYRAIKSGFRAIDTAAQPRHYQEDLVGAGIRRAIAEGIVRREDLFIQTKYTSPSGQDPFNLPYDPAESVREQVRTSIVSSLHNLRTPGDGPQYLDSFLLHSPLDTMSETLEAWGVLGEFVGRGQIRHIGISNCPLPILQRLEGEVLAPAIVQNRFYPDTSYESELRAYCRRLGIVFQSFWTLTGNPMLVTDLAVMDLARKVGVEEEVALYALVLGLKGISVLDGTTKEDRMVGDLMGVEMVGEWASGNKVEWEDLMARFKELLGEDSRIFGDEAEKTF